MQIGMIILLFIVGACIGSFLCCQARRLRLRQTHKKSLGKRSVCPYCKYRLKWFDNIPIISWLALKGKCRKCHHKIGAAEIISELLLAVAFALLSTTINPTSATTQEWCIFIVVLIFTTIISFLAIYDGLYGELPTAYLIAAVICAIIILALKEWAILSISPFLPSQVWLPLASVLLLGGLYLVLFLISKGTWVGDGDWLLATAIAIVLGHPWLALIALFLTNFIAILYALPKIKLRPRIHLGPFMVIAFLIVYAFFDFFQNML